MNWYTQSRTWLGRPAIQGLVLVAVVAIGGYFVVSANRAEVVEPTTPEVPLVTLTSAQQFAGASTINLIGTVRAFSEAAITSEKSGRVTSVRVGLGDTVAAGTVLATLENAAEQASVLSAQGAYEAALAAAAQSEVGTAEAQTRILAARNSYVSTLKNTYTTIDNIINSNVDQFYSDPDGLIVGLRIDGRGFTQTLNATRIEYQTLLPQLKERSASVTVTSDFTAEYNFASAQVAKALTYIDTFITVFQNQSGGGRYSREEIVAFQTTFSGIRSSLIQTQSQLDSAATTLQSAQESLERAELAAAGGTNSAADAQVKQALGSLRAAQANLAQAVIRTPIGGTINSLNIRTGDFINSFVQVAQVANNNALEVVTFAGTKDREVIAIGDTVQLDGRVAGVVTRIAPAVDSATGKTEVRIASESEDLQNGDSVNITKQVEESVTTDVIIPLSAVKFALTDGSVFVVEDGRLVDRPVTLGTIRGGTVEITSGLTVDEQFVADARGLVAGTEVEIIQ